MDDLISRQTALDAMENCEPGEEPFMIKSLPSTDAVEVVRCKDCYHYDEKSEKCILNNSEMKPMDYCSYGSK